MTKKKVKKVIPKTVKIKVPEMTKKMQKISDEVMDKVNLIKTKFNEIDPETKKKIAIGIGAAAAGLFALAGIKKQIKKK